MTIIERKLRQRETSSHDATAFALYPSLRDRVVFVTGGASGIGAEEVTQFAAQGARWRSSISPTTPARALVARLRRSPAIPRRSISTAI